MLRSMNTYASCWISSISGQNFFLGILFSNTLNFCSSRKVRVSLTCAVTSIFTSVYLVLIRVAGGKAKQRSVLHCNIILQIWTALNVLKNADFSLLLPFPNILHLSVFEGLTTVYIKSVLFHDIDICRYALLSVFTCRLISVISFIL
jgi:hypothetical protein